MCALASLPARSASQVKANEAETPALAAAATCPLRLADLTTSNVRALLVAVHAPDIRTERYIREGITLDEARLVYTDSGAAIAMLASILRRCEWRDLLAAREPSLDLVTERILRIMVPSLLKTLCLMLESPFYVTEGPDRKAAVREAARR